MVKYELQSNIERINKPSEGFSLDLNELWRYRYTISQLIMRNFKARYRQSILGIAWAILEPLITMTVFTLIFTKVTRVPSYDIPYPLFSFAGLVPWNLFAQGITMASTSVVTNSILVKEVYLPRLIIPLTSVFFGFINFLIAFVILLLMMLYYGYWPTLRILLLPLLVVLIFTTLFGTSLWLSALHVRFRDIGQMVQYVIRIMLFLTPVAYPSNVISEPWRTLYGLNPMVTVIEGFRWALLDVETLYLPSVILSCMMATLLLITGVIYFNRAESAFPDII